MVKIGRILGKLLIGVVVLAILSSAAGAYYFKIHLPKKIAPLSFPQIDGRVQSEGLDGPVDIYRDAWGIAHVYAGTLHDLFFAQGYVHAQERFWQMDTWRHIGSGQLSEMFGESQVETDAFLRTLGWRKTAEAEYELLDEKSKQILNSYSEGVNAYLANHSGNAVSLEYAILKLLTPDYKIDPWKPVHSLTWGKAMAWDLRGNMSEEIERAILLKNLGAERVDELFPAYPEDHPVIVNEMMTGIPANAPSTPPTQFDVPEDLLAAVEYNNYLLEPMLGAKNGGIGSNSWVISGNLSATGSPLLANDPHLSSQMPSIWYQIDLQCQPKNAECPFTVAGFSFAGVPGVIIGHNEDIAWGLTNLGPDVMDLFIEKVNPKNPDQYEANGSWVDFETRTETILLAGRDPQEITIRSTRHGPVISDVYGPLKNEGDPKDEDFLPFKENSGLELPDPYVLALAWTALTPSSPFKAIWGFNTARNWEEFRQAARDFHVPAQNLVYADNKGNIGYQMPGDIPMRKSGDGRYPVPGWTGEYDWEGYIPFEELPSSFNPPEGYIVAANNEVPPRDYPYLITSDWDHGYRAQRILDLIKSAPGKIDIAYIEGMQADNYDANAEVLVPLLLSVEAKSATQNEANGYEILRNWDFQAGSDSAAAAIFEATWNHLLLNTFADDLPHRYQPEGGDRWMEVMRQISSEENSYWWDDQSTIDVIESRDFMLEKSFSEGIAELENLQGNDLSQWSWGGVHTVTFRNGTLGDSGIGLIEDLFNRGPFQTSGGKAILNATGWDTGVSYEVDWLPSMRMIVDLGDLNNSKSMHTTGQSGHAYHPHYIDMAPAWANVDYYPMLWDKQDVKADAVSHLVLEP